MKEEEKEVEELKGIGSWNGRKREKLEEGGGGMRGCGWQRQWTPKEMEVGEDERVERGRSSIESAPIDADAVA